MTKTLESCSQVAVNASLPPATSASTAEATTQDDIGVSGSKTLPSKSSDKYDKLQNKAHSSVCSSNFLENHTNSLAVEEKSVTNLDDEGLRALLDEAITYKTPKDREGKSKLFNSLLTDAEDEIRKNHAYNASGPARYYSSTAKKRHRQRRQPSSISENLTHGGSLNDLAKQELYESTKMQRPKTVSTRQREGGSLPCNVNAGASPIDRQYFIEECAKLDQRNKKTYPDKMPHEQKFHLDEGLHLVQNDPVGDSSKGFLSRFQSKPNFYNARMPEEFVHLKIPNCSNSDPVEMDSKDFSIRHVGAIKPDGIPARPPPEKKLDENGNAVSTSGLSAACASNNNSSKRKSKQKKVEKVICSHEIEGHRADIINNIDELVNFIDGTEDNKAKSKKLHKQHSHSVHPEEKNKNNSKRSRKKSSEMLHKSNSMEEISTTKLEDFSFDTSDANKEKAPLRPTKSNVERPSRHSTKTWGSSSEHFASTTSVDNSESTEFICVTKKKRSKKQRRNSLGSRRDDNGSLCGETRPAEFHSLRVSSPRRRKSTSSAPHSEKSVDSSDNESLHSLPLDGENKGYQISYADIAKSSERPKWNRPPSERRKPDKLVVIAAPEDAPAVMSATLVVAPVEVAPLPIAVVPAKDPCPEPAKPKETDTDLSSLQNWPEIRNNKVNSAKTINMDGITVATGQDWPSIISNGGKQPVLVKPPQNQLPVMQQPQQWHPKADNKGLSSRSKPITVNNKMNVSTVALTTTTGKKGQWNNTSAVEVVHPHLQQVYNNQIMDKPKIPGQQPSNQQLPVAAHVVQHQQEVIDTVVLNNTQQVIQQVSEQQPQLLYTYKMPPNIRDVQSIEKMQMRSLQAGQPLRGIATTDEDVSAEVCLQRTCAFCMHSPPLRQPPQQQHFEGAAAAAPITTIPSVNTSEKQRPAVVILSSGSGDREMTTDITFGFGINEQLLNGDVCADFCNRFIQPEIPTSAAVQVEKLVNYIGAAWDDCLLQVHTGKVKYYTDNL